MILPSWLQKALFATAVMNISAGVAFLPPAAALRASFGFPEGGHPLYLCTVSMFVALFGFGYLAAALAGRIDRLFLTLGAVGKLAFFTLVTWLWAAGAVTGQAALSASADLFFAVLFLKALYDTRPTAVGEALAVPAR